jgi:hypothetical protein
MGIPSFVLLYRGTTGELCVAPAHRIFPAIHAGFKADCRPAAQVSTLTISSFSENESDYSLSFVGQLVLRIGRHWRRFGRRGEKEKWSEQC